MSFPFVDVDDYRRMYPERCSGNQQVAPPATAHVELVFDTNKTPAMVIQEFSSKSHKKVGDVHFAELEELDTNTGKYSYTCSAKMVKFTGFGKARTKKFAKQIACYELLKSAVMMDRYKDFHIPANSKEEALKILEQIKPVDEDSAGNGENQAPVHPVNWIGKLTEFCSQNKLRQADYDFEENGPPNQRTYTAHAILGTAKGSATGKKKKDAKNAAAQKLLQILEPQVNSLKKATDQMEGKGGEMGADDDDEPIEGLLAVAGVNVAMAHLEAEPQKALEDVMKDKTRFLPNFKLQYRDLAQPSTRGRAQTLLTVQYNKAPPQPIVHPDGSVTTPKVDRDAPVAHNYVFCGEGTEAKLARDEAARAALVHFLTIKGPREATPASNH